jgi:protein-L-isoaspartate(D-aspartate) O-methyltransferase
MVSGQLVPRGISDPAVLKAFGHVPRQGFVPPGLADQAYADHPLPIGCGQTISQPYMVALMTQCLHPAGDSRVLEIGTGSGYQTAILAEICRRVYTVERDKVLLETAGKALSLGGYRNIELRHGDGTLGWPEEAPYDGIVVTAGAPRVPRALKEQLADGGRLVIPVGSLFSQVLLVITRHGHKYAENSVCGCVFVPLVGKDGWEK